MDDKRSDNEENTNFNYTIEDSEMMSIDYSPNAGWGNSGGYSVIIIHLLSR